jgi:hypothetical protein
MAEMSEEEAAEMINKLIMDFIISFVGFIVIAIFMGQGGQLLHESFPRWVMIFGLANIVTAIGGFYI